MRPRLIAISGPATGQTFPIHDERFTIGRQEDNDLQLASLEVSRHHCELRRDDEGRYVVVDLDSRHGVFINNRPVRERLLGHSDLVTVGGSVLLFLLDDSSAGDADSPDTARFSVPEGSFVAMSTVVRKPTEVLYLDPSRVDAALPAEAVFARDLHALLRASAALQGPLSLQELGRCVLAAALELVPAERAAVRIREAGEDEMTLLATRTRGGGKSEGAVLPDHAVFERVQHEKTGILCTGASDASDNKTGNVAALLCTPLLDREGQVMGIVHGEHRRVGAFDERHLDLLGSVCAIASLAFQNALHVRWLESENRRLRDHQLRHDMVGESAPMRRLFDLIARVARAETTVLVRGESGTGKELTAQAIHRSSPRAHGPFVAVNCATLSETLLESELFGHEKGAFTGAVERKLGKLEVARGGTVFLDEVGEIPPPLQAKLLRVLQEREFERVGGTRTIHADVRVVAATNRDLEAAVRDGSFREDFYYRLKVIILETPPLRQRRGDIPLLASQFVALHSRRLGRKGISVAPTARRCLMAYPWPGNVRELGNVIERALVLGETDVIGPEDLPDEVVEGSAEVPSEFQAALTEYKKKLVIDAYRKAGHDYGSAARLLGIHVNSLHRMISRLGIKDRLVH